MQAQGGKYLIFALGKEEYGIPIGAVREINAMMAITAVPKTPEAVIGVINLRGRIIPVMDLRIKFGLSRQDYTERTCLVVVHEATESGKLRQWALVVDAVSEVLNVPEADIAPPPSHQGIADGGLLQGIGKVRERVLLLLDIAKVLENMEAVEMRAEAM